MAGMEPLLEFAGSYWWLGFPLIGGAIGIIGAWQEGARARHKRRLEIVRAKSELSAARVLHGERAGIPSSGVAEGYDFEPSPLARLTTTHDEVTARWLDYELDVGKVIQYPAMSDGRQPLTAAFLRAKHLADGLRPASPTAQLTPAELREYRDAVTDFEVAFDLAERDARRLKMSGFTEAERKRLDTAQQLLAMAVDTAATPAERQLAYRRIREELDGLLSLSDGAIDVLEKRVARELPAGDSNALAPHREP